MSVRNPGAQPRLKSWGGPRFGPQHRGACAPRPVKGQAGCWVPGVPLWGSGVLPPGKCLKTQMLNPAFCRLLAVKFLAFRKLRPRSWRDQYIVGPTEPKSWGTSDQSLRLLRLCRDHSYVLKVCEHDILQPLVGILPNLQIKCTRRRQHWQDAANSMYTGCCCSRRIGLTVTTERNNNKAVFKILSLLDSA